MEEGEDYVRCPALSLSPISLRQDLSLNRALTIFPVNLAQRPSCPCALPLGPEVQVYMTTCSFYVSVSDLISSLYENTLSIKSSPQPRFGILFVFIHSLILASPLTIRWKKKYVWISFLSSSFPRSHQASTHNSLLLVICLLCPLIACFWLP